MVVITPCIVVFMIQLSTISGLYSCQDDSGLVDWYVIYKFPKLKDHPNQFIKTGEGYAYITSRNSTSWILSDKSINDSKSLPGLTLAPLYKTGSKEAIDVMYNDQPPGGNVSFTGGHTKGVVVAGNTGGFWLIHSVPHYPPPPSAGQYSYPATGLRNGQSYLCLTLPPDQLDLIGTQLMYNYPHIFFNTTPAGLSTRYPNLTRAAHGADNKSPPWNNREPLVSVGGTKFLSFAKSPDFKKDLYSDWVVAELQVSLLVETWPNGPGRLNSSCHLPLRVENVDGIKVSVVGENFSSQKDHSKWAISEDKDAPWVCIGDINRATTQEIRGGGTTCLKDPTLWAAFFSSISSVESCPKP